MHDIKGDTNSSDGVTAKRKVLLKFQTQDDIELDNQYLITLPSNQKTPINAANQNSNQTISNVEKQSISSGGRTFVSSIRHIKPGLP